MVPDRAGGLRSDRNPRGGCDRGEVAKSVKRRASALRACYEMQLLSKPGLHGKVEVQWTIDPAGRVRGQKMVANTMHNHAVTDCVMRTIGRIRFKAPDGGVCVIQWPFVFVSGG